MDSHLRTFWQCKCALIGVNKNYGHSHVHTEGDRMCMEYEKGDEHDPSTGNFQLTNKQF